jgi:signal transduction histidine kinase
MSVKLSLTAKSLMLVSIPLLIEVGFVWALVNLQHETEVEALQAIQSRDTLQRLSTVTGKIYQVWSVFDAKKKSKDQVKLAKGFFGLYNSTYIPILASLKKDYSELDELTKDKPDLNLDVKKARRSLDAISAFLDQALVDVKSGRIEQVAASYHQGADRVVGLFQELTTENFALAAKSEHDSALVSSQRHSAFRQTMVAFVLVACAFNAAFCALLAAFLVRGIIFRLNVMSDNARRLAANKPLNEPIAGQDEIAELDRVFHRMAASIEETARMRQELVSMLTHDLRSPLTALQGSLELLDYHAEQARAEQGTAVQIRAEQARAEHSKVERDKKLIDVAQRNSARMMRLINDLLDIHKIKEGMITIAPTEVCLAEVFEEVALSVAAWIEDNAIRLKLDDTDLFVFAEREKVERIIFNLIANAIKFSPSGGTIMLSAKSEGRMVQISVSDQGKGIAAEQQDSIFERFQQIETNDEKQSAGSGLGLTICQYLVHLHGGEIWVVSAPGQGSVFHFTLPLS